MLGFHRRTRSLIPVGDLGKYDELPFEDQETDVESNVDEMELKGVSEPSNKARQRQLTLVYLVFLAEAIMASSLQSQLQMLISGDESCGTISTSYLSSILNCAYAFGGTTGIFWGYLADRMGRRRVTLLGLWAMLICCLSMGFATDLASCTIFRYLAGLASSTVLVTTLTMLGDLSQNNQERAQNVARLPLIALFGSMGPIAQTMVAESLRSSGVWEKYPVLGPQLACGTIVAVIAITASILLEETLPLESNRSTDAMDMDCEKAAFLSADEFGEPTVAVVDFVRPEAITINQFLSAPSLVVLLASFSLLSLHASVFDVVLPHLGHSNSQHGGMGISCSWLGLTVLGVKAVASITLAHVIPTSIEKYGLLKLYRSVSVLFPAIYVVTPVLAVAAASSSGFVTVTSTAALLVKHLLSGGASILVALLVLNTTPDAYSAGTVVGLMQVANLFKALAVAVSGASFYLSNDISVATTNLALWSCLAGLGAVGAALAYFVRERPSVERDFPSEVLSWETCFEYDAEKIEYDV
ncbi:MFS general substrate transporter [Byssothecium circinans]|uniref:MFS general substrate transporter n=1 Tax=Byssothecium circinans TaxID=147558 RepID=A0A6A5TG96_9PLEO|nr:MFS general substrate transporter [Byssothecium circinans]